MKRLTKTFLPSLKAAERFVSDNSTLNDNGWKARWNGWKIEVFTPDPGGFYNTRGSYDRVDGWGYTYTFSPDARGRYHVRTQVVA